MELESKLIQLLADGGFHSGSRLAGQLGVSRTTVWKTLQKLHHLYGVEIHSVKGRGYRLAQSIDLLDERKILENCQSRDRLRGLDIHQSIESTNQWLAELPQAEFSGRVCLAECQTAGRGRRGRRWVSPFGQSLYLSIGWQFNCGAAELSGLSLAAGVAVARVLDQEGVPGVGLKWPNDLLWNDRKLAGLLLEVSGEQGGPSRVVLGLGLNVSLSHSQVEEIDQPWVDLARICEHPPARNLLASRLIDSLLQLFSSFEVQGPESLVESWNRFDVYRGRAVALLLGKERIEGVHRGIDATGALLLETADGLRTFHGGEVSLRRGK